MRREFTPRAWIGCAALVVPRRAAGYGARESGGFCVAMSDFEQLGDGAVQTSVEDLLKWNTNFYSRAVGGAALQGFLHRTGTLNDGKPIEYARGPARRHLPRPPDPRFTAATLVRGGSTI